MSVCFRRAGAQRAGFVWSPRGQRRTGPSFFLCHVTCVFLMALSAGSGLSVPNVEPKSVREIAADPWSLVCVCVCSFMSVFCQWLCEYVCESEIAGWFYCKCWLEVNVIQRNRFKRPDLAMLSDLLNCSEVSVSDPHSVLLSTGNEGEKSVYLPPHGPHTLHTSPWEENHNVMSLEAQS